MRCFERATFTTGLRHFTLCPSLFRRRRRLPSLPDIATTGHTARLSWPRYHFHFAADFADARFDTSSLILMDTPCFQLIYFHSSPISR